VPFSLPAMALFVHHISAVADAVVIVVIVVLINDGGGAIIPKPNRAKVLSSSSHES